MATVDVFERTETVSFLLYVYNLAGTLVDPDTGCTITIVDSRGTKVVDTIAMTKTDTGTYTYNYTTLVSSALGRYHGTLVAVDSSTNTIATIEFIVRAQFGE